MGSATKTQKATENKLKSATNVKSTLVLLTEMTEIVADRLVFFIQFNGPFRIISAHMRRDNQKVGRKRGNLREKPPGTPPSRTWLVSHVPRVGLELTPDTDEEIERSCAVIKYQR